MRNQSRQSFWVEALALRGSITPHVAPRVLFFGLFAAAVCAASWTLQAWLNFRLSLETSPHELAGAVLGVLLVLRTNAGHERWWEARKLWGGIVNQSRNLAIGAAAYGPTSEAWRKSVAEWVAVFPHVARLWLRQTEQGLPRTEFANEIRSLVGAEEADRLAAAEHAPTFASLKLAELLHRACAEMELDRHAFLQLERERAALMDHMGGCERILNTPMPRAYSITIRRFIVLFLLTLPFALLHRSIWDWLVPPITMFVAFTILALDQIGVEMENPFSESNLSHHPLEEITETIEHNVSATLKLSKTGGQL